MSYYVTSTALRPSFPLILQNKTAPALQMRLHRNNNLMLPVLTSLLTLNIFERVKRQRCIAIDSILNTADDVPQRFYVLMNHG